MGTTTTTPALTTTTTTPAPTTTTTTPSPITDQVNWELLPDARAPTATTTSAPSWFWWGRGARLETGLSEQDVMSLRHEKTENEKRLETYNSSFYHYYYNLIRGQLDEKDKQEMAAMLEKGMSKKEVVDHFLSHGKSFALFRKTSTTTPAHTTTTTPSPTSDTSTTTATSTTPAPTTTTTPSPTTDMA